MEVGDLLWRLLVVLVAARVAAEIAERLRQPAVLAEIIVGIVLGPSALGIVGHQPSLQFLGELGAILLLFDVGLHMDLKELRHVGRASAQVAMIGVAVPLVLGFVLLRGFGLHTPVALFLASGITATSVGITARVFAEMHALAGIEARTVLGAAVADDVIGLLILAVAVRIGSGEGLSASTLVATPMLAVGFVVVASLVGARMFPGLFRRIGASARTEGTLTAIALALALGLGAAASAVQLAPIVGAFVAGVALGGSGSRDELVRRMAPIGHVLIPIFFLLIGAETRLQAFGDGWVLGVGAALTVVAFAGKVCAGLGIARGRADRLLIGVGMIPRGEVGLIFASLGLARGVLDARTQAVLILVVLLSTLVPPPWIRRRIQATRARAIERASVAEPPGGWLELTDEVVDLAGEPPAPLRARIAFEAALACASRRPGSGLLDWLSTTGGPPAEWDDGLRARFFDVVRHGNVRSWRFLEVSGVLVETLPELETIVTQRMRDPFDLDPAGALHWDVLEALKLLIEREPYRSIWIRVERPQIVMLAALLTSAFNGDGSELADRIAARIGLGDSDRELLRFVVDERHLLPAASSRLSFGAEESVLEIATHAGSLARAAALYLLASASIPEPERREALDELFALIRSALEHPELTGAAATDLLESRRREIRLSLDGLPRDLVERHVREAPRRYLLSQSPAAVGRHLKLLDPPLRSGEVRLRAYQQRQPGVWTVDVVMQDRPGALAVLTGAFSRTGVSVKQAFCSSWASGVLIDVFTAVEASPDTDWKAVSTEAERLLATGEGGIGDPIEGSVDIDNVASPWHTIVEVRAKDRHGLLYRVASALARVGAEIHTATVSTVDTIAVDTFLVTGPNGHKLDQKEQRALRVAFEGGTPSKRRLWQRRDNKVVTRT